MKILKTKRGNWTVSLALLMPVLIGIMGFAIDGGMMLYKANQLSSSVKIAAISATSIYEEDYNGDYIISADFYDAESLLKANMPDAELISFDVDPYITGQCTVEGCCYVEFVFMKIFHIEGKTITSSFTAWRGAAI